MKTIGYIRVSTKKQAQFGGSIETQTEQIKQYCALKGLDLVGFLQDTSSAKAIQSRPAMLELIAKCSAGEAQAFVTCKLDRMFRNTVEGLTTADAFEAMAVDMHFMDIGDGCMANIQTAMGRMMFTQALMLGEFERRRVGERVADVFAHKKKVGEQHSHQAPFGWQYKDGKRLPHPQEYAALKLIWTCMFLHGNTLTATTDSLSLSAHKTRHGRTVWAKSTVLGIINNPTNEDVFVQWHKEHDAAVAA